jgi:hypothetical protein
VRRAAATRTRKLPVDCSDIAFALSAAEHAPSSALLLLSQPQHALA